MRKPSAPHAQRIGLLAECYHRSERLLHENLTPAGIMASSASVGAARRNYTAVFGRDAAICALGMVLSGDATLRAGSAAGLISLAEHQAANGQIPKFVHPQAGEADFWYSGCIDAGLWWLIAVRFVELHAPELGLRERLDLAVRRALNWLSCQEHQGFFLLQQNEASDWADIMPRSGFVLYTNALWYWVKRLYGLPQREATRHYANRLFFPFDRERPEHRRARLLAHYVRNKARRRDVYLSYVNFSFWGEEIDVFGNVLGLLTGLPEDRRLAREIVTALRARGVAEPHPVRVVGEPLRPDQPDWRPYMQRHRQNFPYQYHNGGIWPFAGAFWALLVAQLDGLEAGWEALAGVAAANRVAGWRFSEWLHGRTGTPAGMAGQSWNAAAFIFAYRVLEDGLDLAATARAGAG
jgi:hypothetical protein